MAAAQTSSSDSLLLLLYRFQPNQGAAIVAVVVFALIAVAVTAVTVRTRAWYMLLVSVTAVLELAGWGSRLSTLSSPVVATYQAHQALLIISPVLLAIVQFITVQKLLLLPHRSTSGGSKCGSPRTRAQDNTPGLPSVVSAISNNSTSSIGHPILAQVVVWLFSGSEVLCLILQTAGAAVYAAQPANALYGRLLLLAGLGLELASFTGFLVLVAFIQTNKYFGFRGDASFRPVFICLYATTLLLRLRELFRIGEFAQGYGGNVALHESYLYALDFLPVVLCFLFLTMLHYGFWLGPAAPAVLARQAAHMQALQLEAAAAAEKEEQQQQQQPSRRCSAEILHVHCN